MPTPVNGSISFQDLANELRGSSVGAAVHAISMADVYNNANLSVGTVATSQSVLVSAGNIITQSETFGAARWTKSGVIVQIDQEVAPDGTTTADRLTNNIGAGTYVEQTDLETIQPGTTYNHSVYVKGFGSSVGAVVAIGNFDNGARVGATSITLTANWQRMFASFVGTATFSRNIFIQLNGFAGTGATANLAINQSVFAWGYQITTGSALQAYTKTVAAIAPQVFNTITVFTNTSVAALGAISMSQFYGVSKPSGRVTITITVPSTTFTSNLNLYNIALRQGYSTGLTDVVLNIGTGAIVGSVGSSYAETATVSFSQGTGEYTRGNLVNNSANMSDGAFWQWGPFNNVSTSFPVTHGIISPNGSTSGVAAIFQTDLSTNDYFQQAQTLMNATTTYCISVWLKGFGTSIGQRVSVGTSQTQSSLTLTAQWQRLICNTNGSGAQRFLLYTNGGSQNATNSRMLGKQTVFAWGPMVTTSVGAGASAVNQQYVETTGTGYIHFSPPKLNGSYNIYTTSETMTTSYAVAVPSRFNAGDTVRIVNNGTIVGASGRGGQGGYTAEQPAAGFPTPVVGKPGGRGGDALGIFRPVTIDNTGVIGGGGGGGGGGSAGPGTTPKGAATTFTGGSGGGGAGADPNIGFFDYTAVGIPAPKPSATYTLGTPPAQASFTAGVGGARGTGPVSNATVGANGGAIGTTGSTSTASPLGGAQPGGAPGHYVVGSPLVTWVNTGTRSGSVG